MRSLLDQMQQAEMQKAPKRKYNSAKWDFFNQHKNSPEIIAQIRKDHNMQEDDIPWQLIKRKTDELFAKIAFS
jgi:hypothetical protein